MQWCCVVLSKQETKQVPILSGTDYYRQHSIAYQQMNVFSVHCPEQSRSCKLIKNPKWYSEEITVARRDRRKLERKWRKTRTAENHDKFLDQHATVNKLIKDSKIEYFRTTIDNADAKTMYTTLNTLLNSSVQKLPSCDSNVTLSNKFVHYFT